MLCQNERGVLAGSDFFLPAVSDSARKLYYHTAICGHYHCEPGYEIARDSAQSYLLMTLAQGQLSLACGGAKTVASAGDTVLLDCYAPHRYAALSYLEFSWMHLAGANSQALCDFITGGNGCLVSTQQHGEVSALLAQLLSRFRNRQRVTEPMCARAIYDILCCLMPDAGLLAPVGGQDTPIGRVAAYLQNHLAEPLTLSALAAQAQLSPFHFSRVFKKEIGYSPYEYIILLRINQAKYLLKNSPLSIKEISALVGYSTEISFVSAFSQKVGLSPGKFRKLPLG